MKNLTADAAVHPRVCGEHLKAMLMFNLVDGSSPRVRGTYAATELLDQDDRFIPACAGNMYANECCTQNPTVHPRVCGEHLSYFICIIFFAGSSPRVRGTSRVSPVA